MHHQLLSARRLVLAQTREKPETFENVFGYREASVSYFLREKQKQKMVPTIFLLLITVLNKNPKFVNLSQFVVCLTTLWLKRLFLSLNRD